MLMDLMQNKQTKSSVFANYITAQRKHSCIMRACNLMPQGILTV